MTTDMLTREEALEIARGAVERTARGYGKLDSNLQYAFAASKPEPEDPERCWCGDFAAGESGKFNSTHSGVRWELICAHCGFCLTDPSCNAPPAPSPSHEALLEVARRVQCCRDWMNDGLEDSPCPCPRDIDEYEWMLESLSGVTLPRMYTQEEMDAEKVRGQGLAGVYKSALDRVWAVLEDHDVQIRPDECADDVLRRVLEEKDAEAQAELAALRADLAAAQEESKRLREILRTLLHERFKGREDGDLDGYDLTPGEQQARAALQEANDA